MVENANKEAPKLKLKLKLKLSLKRETLRSLTPAEVCKLENVVGGTCACSLDQARTFAITELCVP